ncbi:MAG: hypothetical protein KAH14_10945 [Clostridiales bacterium]|nr:hypothetical protein [Clostridiales bacterium]
MISLEEMELLLEEITLDFPREIFVKLNGGIVLLPEAKRNEKIKEGNMFILGEYHSGGNMGRYIAIYYGSFRRVFGHLNEKLFKNQLIKTVKHEFTHHLESLAGERDLEIKDAEYIARYLNRRNK